MYSRTITMIQRKIYSKKESARRLQKKRGDILDSVWEVEEQFIATVKDIIQNCVYCHPANYLESFSSVYLDVLSAPCKLTVKLKAGCSAK